MKTKSTKSHKPTKTEIALMQEIDTLKLRLKEQEEIDKLNKELVARMKALEDNMKKEPKQKAETQTINPDELCLNIEYDKYEDGQTDNYYGKLVHAYINHSTGKHYFALLGQDNQTRYFRKDKTKNAAEVEEAVQKMFALRAVAKKDEQLLH